MKSSFKRHLLELLLLGFIIVLIICKLISPSYNLYDYSLSHLGVVPETALLFNLTLIVLGIGLIFNFRWNLPQSTHYLYNIGNKLLYIMSIAIIVLGFVPFNVNNFLHYIFAGLLAFSMIGAVFAYGMGYRKSSEFSKGRYSLIFSLVALLGLIILAVVMPGLAISELFVILVLFLWWKIILRV